MKQYYIMILTNQKYNYMNQIILFRVLEIIIRKYSKMSPRFLIDNFLRLKIIFNLSNQSISLFLSETDLSPALLSVFTNRTRGEKMVNFSCIILDHPKLLTLAPKLFQEIESCIVVDHHMLQSNNILGTVQNNQRQQIEAKVIIFRTTRQNFDSFSQSLDSYLSLCELFHSHIHLIVNSFQCYSTLIIREHISEVEGDEFQGVVEQGYFRILEQRASKVTLQELSEICDIERTEWGQVFVFQGGHDGLIIWISQQYLPKLGASPNVAIPLSHSKQYLLFYSTEVGYKIFKKKQLMKEKMHQMNFTTIIFNFDKYTPQMEKVVNHKFEQYCKRFFSEVVIKTEMRLLQQNIKQGQRMCQILGLQGKEVLQKLLQM